MTTLAQALDEVRALQTELAAVRAQLEWLRKKLFGPGQGERLDRAQLLLQLEALEKLAAPAAVKPQIVAAHERSPAQKRVAPAESFAHLPVKETIEIVPEAVQADPTLYERIGEEESFEVDIVPPKLFKRRIVRPKYRHRLERSRAPIVALAPALCPVATSRRGCSLGFSCPNTSTINRSTGRSKCRRGGARGSRASRWSSGSRLPRPGSK